MPRLTAVLAGVAVLAGAAPAHGHDSQANGWDWTQVYTQRPVAQAAAQARAAQAEAYARPLAPAHCRPGSSPTTGMTGRVSRADIAARGGRGFTCNTELLGRHGTAGGFKVERFVDSAGRECGYYDTTLLFPTNPVNPGQRPAGGVVVLDMSDPSSPVETARLLTPAMQSPHESVLLNHRRGLLAASLSSPAFQPAVIDIYDLNRDCRHPELLASAPVGFTSHESAFSPDGNTFWVTSLYDSSISAIDVTNPRLPVRIWTGRHNSHGMTISDDGNRAYLAALSGLVILDVSEIQARRLNPQAREVGRVTWPELSIPQVALPMTIDGRPYLFEVDEFSTSPQSRPLPAENGPSVGAARIIDISDERDPRVVSNLRLDVHQPENRAEIRDDPGASGTQSYVQGYAGHYCGLPQREDPGVAACSFIVSGLRIFDIQDPRRPREIGYYVAPQPEGSARGNWAMAAPVVIPERREVWYSDGASGFYSVRVTRDAWPADVRGERCTPRWMFTFKLNRDRGARVVRVDAYVNGRRRVTRRGRSLRRVTIPRLTRGRHVVRIVSRQSNGYLRVSTRRYRDCTKTAPRTIRRRAAQR